MEVISHRSFGEGKPKPPLCCSENWKNPRKAKKEVVFCEVTKLVSVFLVVRRRFHFSTLGQGSSTCSQNILLVWMPNMHSRESVERRKQLDPRQKPLIYARSSVFHVVSFVDNKSALQQNQEYYPFRLQSLQSTFG